MARTRVATVPHYARSVRRARPPLTRQQTRAPHHALHGTRWRRARRGRATRDHWIRLCRVLKMGTGIMYVAFMRIYLEIQLPYVILHKALTSICSKQRYRLPWFSIILCQLNVTTLWLTCQKSLSNAVTGTALWWKNFVEILPICLDNVVPHHWLIHYINVPHNGIGLFRRITQENYNTLRKCVKLIFIVLHFIVLQTPLPGHKCAG